jgi:hypothetical protein
MRRKFNKIGEFTGGRSESDGPEFVARDDAFSRRQKVAFTEN